MRTPSAESGPTRYPSDWQGKLLVLASEKSVKASTLKDLCNFLGISYNEGSPDKETLIDACLDILNNDSLLTLSREKQVPLVKSAFEVVGGEFLDIQENHPRATQGADFSAS